jgi:hypothetical protein
MMTDKIRKCSRLIAVTWPDIHLILNETVFESNLGHSGRGTFLGVEKHHFYPERQKFLISSSVKIGSWGT